MMAAECSNAMKCAKSAKCSQTAKAMKGAKCSKAMKAAECSKVANAMKAAKGSKAMKAAECSKAAKAMNAAKCSKGAENMKPRRWWKCGVLGPHGGRVEEHVKFCDHESGEKDYPIKDPKEQVETPGATMGPQGTEWEVIPLQVFFKNDGRVKIRWIWLETEQ